MSTFQERYQEAMREADEVHLEDLLAAADFYDRYVMHPTAVDAFGGNTNNEGPYYELRSGDDIVLVDYFGRPHPLYTECRVKNFSVSGLYCWFYAKAEHDVYVFLALGIRGKFRFNQQQWLLVKKGVYDGNLQDSGTGTA